MTVIAFTAARTATGERVDTPPYADDGEWACFAANVVIVGECALWIGQVSGDGYGRFDAPAPASVRPVLFGVDQPAHVRAWGAHRWAWQAWCGPIPAGLQVMHVTCDEPLCVPVTADSAETHFAAGTAGDNARDRVAKGRSGSTRHGVRTMGADLRGPLGRTRAIRQALREALRAGMRGAELVAVVDRVRAAGHPRTGQLTLIDERIVRQRGPSRLSLASSC